MCEISIIVPVYNIELYVKECIESILRQTFKNFELILVDDGSTDQSGKICDEYALKDTRIIVIHQKNQGLSQARNTGIDIAKGKYIGFVDGDDWIHEEMFLELYNLCVCNNVKISQCNYQRCRDTCEQFDETEGEVCIISKEQEIRNLYDPNLAVRTVVAWNKLYDTELFKNIRYPQGKLHEDEFTTYKLIFGADEIAITNRKLYFYRTVESSIINQKYNPKRLDVLEALEERIKFFEKYKELERLALEKMCDTIISVYYRSLTEQLEADVMDYIRTKGKLFASRIFFRRGISANKKVKYFFVLWCPQLYLKIAKKG